MKITIPSDNAGNLRLTQKLQKALFPEALKRYAFRSRLVAVTALIAYCLLIGLCIWGLEGRISDEIFIAILIVSIVVFLAALVMIQKRIKTELERDVSEKMNKQFPDGTPIVLSIEQDGLRSRSENVDLLIKWPGIFAIEPLDSDATAVLNGRMSFAIPHSVFRDEDEKNAFHAELHRQWKAGQVSA